MPVTLAKGGRGRTVSSRAAWAVHDIFLLLQRERERVIRIHVSVSVMCVGVLSDCLDGLGLCLRWFVSCLLWVLGTELVSSGRYPSQEP